MDSKNSALLELLRSQGFNLTTQRLIVFNALLDMKPISIAELIIKLKGKLDRASIYRTIDLFTRIGITNRINIGWKYKIELSDKFQAHHHHITCILCHKIIPIHEKELERLFDEVAQKNGFSPIDHQLEIQGCCKECQVKKQ